MPWIQETLEGFRPVERGHTVTSGKRKITERPKNNAGPVREQPKTAGPKKPEAVSRDAEAREWKRRRDMKRDSAAELRDRRERWRFPVKARVLHPRFGEVTVPCKSKYAAILCAAETWGCDDLEIRDAEVWALEGITEEEEKAD